MYILNDTQAESIKGGGPGLVPPINITVAPQVGVLAQTGISLNTVVLGGRIYNRQNQDANQFIFG